jgi:DNA-directed RNA polymerase subunit RPC12/RpoP
MYTLEWAAVQIRKEAKGENPLVKKRVAKLCKDILALKPYVENIPIHKDFIGICKTNEEFFKRYNAKHYCADCHADITVIGGWQFPQEPKKFYCTACESKRFWKNLKKKGSEE